MQGRYNKDSKLDFGVYKGYELGIVYVFDPPYISWCINNIDKFCISDLDELKEYGVVNQEIDWHIKLIGDPNLIPFIDAYDTFQELLENIDLGDNKFIFTEATLSKNKDKQIRLDFFEGQNNRRLVYRDFDDFDDYCSNWNDDDDDRCACGNHSSNCECSDPDPG